MNHTFKKQQEWESLMIPTALLFSPKNNLDNPSISGNFVNQLVALGGNQIHSSSISTRSTKATWRVMYFLLLTKLLHSNQCKCISFRWMTKSTSLTLKSSQTTLKILSSQMKTKEISLCIMTPFSLTKNPFQISMNIVFVFHKTESCRDGLLSNCARNLLW